MTNNNSFVKELIINIQGNIRICYSQLLEGLEDEALGRAMKTTINETPVSKEKGLEALEKE